MALQSFILYAASLLPSQVGCVDLFVDAALLANRKASEDKALLVSLAETACKTSNPDAIWQIAKVESGFRFRIVAVNSGGKTSKVFQGDSAAAFLKSLAKNPNARPNADIGVLQMNWRAQGEQYGWDPIRMADPSEQVKHLVDNMMGDLSRCGNLWIGCYHSYGNGTLAKGYAKRVAQAGKGMREYLAEALTLRSIASGTSPKDVVDYFDVLGSVKRLRPVSNNRGSNFRAGSLGRILPDSPVPLKDWDKDVITRAVAETVCLDKPEPMMTLETRTDFHPDIPFMSALADISDQSTLGDSKSVAQNFDITQAKPRGYVTTRKTSSRKRIRIDVYDPQTGQTTSHETTKFSDGRRVRKTKPVGNRASASRAVTRLPAAKAPAPDSQACEAVTEGGTC